jgi:hypothetical protein
VMLRYAFKRSFEHENSPQHAKLTSYELVLFSLCYQVACLSFDMENPGRGSPTATGRLLFRVVFSPRLRPKT